MRSQRETRTDNLADIIHIIHLGNKSGMLTVERGEGNNVEEGSITFSNGRVVEAKTGRYSGVAAFNYLNGWQSCRFGFINHADNGNTATGLSSYSPYPKSENSPENVSTAHPLYPHPMKPAMYNGSTGQNGKYLLPAPGPARLPLGEAVLQRPEHMQLPRVHRRLLLLIDGKRTKSELARLMGRSLDELQTLLDDLERTGLIQQ